MSLLQEFKNFAIKGNVVDLAVGLIIGTAFGKIVSSFVKDIVMPPIGVALGGVDFSKLAYVLQEAQGKTEAVTMKYGVFIMTVIDFVIIAFTIFIVVNIISRMQKKDSEEETAKPAAPSKEELLLTEIRDSLANK